MEIMFVFGGSGMKKWLLLVVLFVVVCVVRELVCFGSGVVFVFVDSVFRLSWMEGFVWVEMLDCVFVVLSVVCMFISSVRFLVWGKCIVCRLFE